MNKTKMMLIGCAAVLIAGVVIVATRMNAPVTTTDGRGAIGAVPGVASTERELDPFTHVASIPATVDPKTIRFEKLKTVQLASKTQTSTDPQDCKERQFRDPDGSGCTSVKVLERVKAIEANYSYIGPQIATGEGEIGPTRHTFAVYFRPEELSVNGPVEKLNREQAESLFQFSTSRPMVQQRVIDQQNSHFCEGNYVDGSWVQKDSTCKERVQYMNQAVASQYWAVEVGVRHPVVASR
jgi:hypothetical protein